MPMSHNERLDQFLSPAEELLWTGKPAGGVFFRNEDWLPVATVAFCVIVLAVVYASGSLVGPLDLVIVIVVAAAALSLVLKLAIDALLRRNTTYALSDKRALMLTEWPRRTLRHVPLHRVSHLAITETGAKRQTILLGVSTPPPDWRSGYWWPGLEIFRAPSFEFIVEGWQVYDLLRGLLDGNRSKQEAPAA